MSFMLTHRCHTTLFFFYLVHLIPHNFSICQPLNLLVVKREFKHWLRVEIHFILLRIPWDVKEDEHF